MKHDKKPEPDLKRLTMLAAGTAASVAVLAGGVRLWNGYQNGNLFRADLFVSNHNYQENQIMFPEKNDYGQTSQTDTSDENHRLERDPQADDSYGKDRQEEPQYQMAGDGNVETDLRNASSLLINPGNSEMPDSGNLPQGFENSAAVVANGDGTAGAQNVIQLPSGTSDNNSTGIGFKRDDSDRDSDSDSGSGNRNTGNGNNSGGSGGGGGDSSNNGTTVTPEPVPDPSPTPTPTPTPDPSPVVDPDYPNDGDKPSLPNSPSSWIVSRDFPSEGLPAGARADQAELRLYDLLDDSGETLYYGAILTDWKLLCSIYAYVDVPGTDGNIIRYRLTEYSDNFRVGDFPSVVDGDFTVSFYFRPNSQSEWKEYKKTFSVRYAKIVILDDMDGTVLNEVFLDKGKNVCLLNQLSNYYRNHRSAWGVEDQTWENLTSIFPGWSLTPGGEPLGNWFEPTEPGRYVLYPLDRIELPADYWAYRSNGWDTANDNCYAGYLQALLSGPSDQDILEIPEGIHELWTVTNIGTLILPNSTAFVYPETYSVLDSYKVRDDNPYFRVQNGMLFSKDGTKLLGIPESHYENLVVPEETTYVNLPCTKSVELITLASLIPPEMDLNRLRDTTIIVPKQAYMDYLLAWNQYLIPNGITLIADDGGSLDYEYIGSGFYTDGGRTLIRISPEHSGLFTAAENLETVKENAANGCTNLKQIFFSDKLKRLERYSLSADHLKTIYIFAAEPPEIDAETFGNIQDALARGLQVVVPADSLEAYQNAWRNVLGESALQLLRGASLDEVTTENGLKYMNTEHGSILLQAPADITSFEDIEQETGDTVIWTEIGSHAFDNCTELHTLELPDTINHIDTNAFSGCESLEALHITTTDSVTIEKDAFASDNRTDRLIVVIDAAAAAFDDDEVLPDTVSCYVPNDCTSNILDQLSRWGASYCFKSGETGTFVYGLEADGYFSYLIGATADVSGAIEPPDGYVLTQFDSYALANCYGTLTISDEIGASIFYIGDHAFADSGISGDLHLGNMYQIGSSAFQGCENLGNVVIDPSNYQFSIGENAFSGSSLKSLVLPPNTNNFGLNPFVNCDQLETITFTGENPPRPLTNTLGSECFLGWEGDNIGDFWDPSIPSSVIFRFEDSASIEDYISKWQYWLMGYSSADELLSAFDDPYIYEFDWIWETGIFPEDDDGFLPEYLQYVNDYAAAKKLQVENKGAAKVYWYAGLEIPEDLLLPVELPQISDYADTSGGFDSWDFFSSDTGSSKATASNAEKKPTTASDSNAAKEILDSMHYVTDNTKITPQEEE